MQDIWTFQLKRVLLEYILIGQQDDINVQAAYGKTTEKALPSNSGWGWKDGRITSLHIYKKSMLAIL
jgi:hypothetical protein